MSVSWSWVRTALASAYIAVASEMLEQFYFSQGALGQDLLAEDIGDFLDGNALTRLDIRGSTIDVDSTR